MKPRERLSQATRWSVIAGFGSTVVAKLSIAVPLLGTLLLFNQNVVGALQYASGYLADVGVDPSEAQASTLSSLYFTYFGLCSIGVASLVFSVMCPDEIKRFPDRMKYISSIDFSQNSVIAKSHFQDVLDYYFQQHNSAGDPKHADGEKYPFTLELEFDSLIREMFDAYNQLPEALEGNVEEEGDFLSGLYTATGYPNIAEIAHQVWSSPKVIWAFTQPFRALSVKFARDIAFVRFAGLDVQKPRWRILTAALYLFGFALVALPTIVNFIKLCLGLLGLKLP